METVILKEETFLTERSCATIGFFDGVHRGHRFLIEQLRQLACRRGERSMVVTFERHPRQVICPDWQPQLLTSLEEKESLLAATGIDVMVVLRFDAAMAALSAQAFMSRVLKDRLNVDALLAGYDNRFGHGRTEGFDDYVGYGKTIGIDVVGAEALMQQESAVSSTRIRRFISEGRVGEAADCLGRRYTLSGNVVHGEQVGRQLGFPTANIVPEDSQKLLPADGVYAVEVWTDDGRKVAGVMNIGTRPTFNGHSRTLEVHLLDFSGDLYNRRLTVSFAARLRDECTFTSADALQQQMNLDVNNAREILNG